MNANGNGKPLTFGEQLGRYKLILKQLDLCSHALHGYGFIGDAQLKRIENLIDEEKIRTDRAMLAFGAQTVTANTPAVAGGPPSLDAAKHARAAGAA